ncbi:bifunctional helix-turn-helix transcriptional regulator/GNAT family N-acetyltransferase [Mycolicibacterium sp. 120270]|uniref:bifunctional helix-turn-helix transcriptional regulator/GNAT family N-acetyltransferase n=1 Tax=Mycolicibacterium sp. 120270 TaxID=3090600 RepID=UPI00299D699C|nr:bifunctional helix-turn-helix transcriptional regulator/GNAT family N-acetyltransferase [Mycolicibacterium sp. 120270]MDX1882835.1 bifunctional helix-turn-helix transcriptional regulator/GNAT family N-acetyltransferase [Mycolicibacterium sp. 120270]
MTAEMVAQVRRFNRTVTTRIGVLNDNFLASNRSLGQNRLLWEVGADGCDVRSLRARLDLDSGYLSRLLRSLERDGLLVVGPSRDDGRVRIARLTAAGLREVETLDRRSDEAAAAILAPLNDVQRERLATAMAEVDRLLTASTVEVRECDPREPQAQFCLNTYFAELAERFDGGFDPSKKPFGDEDMTPPAGLLLVATLHGDPVGCGAMTFLPRKVAYIKRMWVARSVRGLGLGRRLLAELEDRARSAGVRTVQLETKDVLREAISLYTSAGYLEVAPFNDEPYADHWFQKALA